MHDFESIPLTNMAKALVQIHNQRKFSGKLPIYELLGSRTGIAVLAVVVLVVVVLVVVVLVVAS